MTQLPRCIRVLVADKHKCKHFVVHDNIKFATLKEMPEMPEVFDRAIDSKELTFKSAILHLWGSRFLRKKCQSLPCISDKLLKVRFHSYMRCIYHHPCQGIVRGMHKKHRLGKCMFGSSKRLLGSSCP